MWKYIPYKYTYMYKISKKEVISYFYKTSPHQTQFVTAPSVPVMQYKRWFQLIISLVDHQIKLVVIVLIDHQI